MMNRTAEEVAPFHIDPHLEDIMQRVNSALGGLNSELVRNRGRELAGPIFITGVQRSGTTLLSQLLSTQFEVGYVSNIMARFWEAPIVGAYLSEELRRKARSTITHFASELGATYGPFEPHEFGYFWRRWLPLAEVHDFSLSELGEEVLTDLPAEVRGMQAVFSAPMTFKNPVATALNLVEMAAIFPGACFIICDRDPVHVIRSTLECRERMNGDRAEWWSIRPKEFLRLRDRSPLQQVAGQVYLVREAIAAAQEELGRRCIGVSYAELCDDPGAQLEQISAAISRTGIPCRSRDGIAAPTGFVCSDRAVKDGGELEEIRRVWNRTPDSEWVQSGS